MIRCGCVDRVWIEQITIVNHRRATSAMRVKLEFDAYLTNLFEVNSGAVARHEVTWRVDGASRARVPAGGVSAVGHDC